MDKTIINVNAIVALTVKDRYLSTKYHYLPAKQFLFSKRLAGIYNNHGDYCGSIAEFAEENTDYIILNENMVYAKAVIYIHFQGHWIDTFYFDSYKDAIAQCDKFTSVNNAIFVEVES